MIARLYPNENFPLPVVAKLRELRYNMLTTGGNGRAEITAKNLQFRRILNDNRAVPK